MQVGSLEPISNQTDSPAVTSGSTLCTHIISQNTMHQQSHIGFLTAAAGNEATGVTFCLGNLVEASLLPHGWNMMQDIINLWSIHFVQSALSKHSLTASNSVCTCGVGDRSTGTAPPISSPLSLSGRVTELLG